MIGSRRRRSRRHHRRPRRSQRAPSRRIRQPVRKTTFSFQSEPRFRQIVRRRVRQQREPNEFAINGTKLDLIYNELPVGGHGIWPKVYSLPEVYDWLFAHTLAADEKPAAK